MVGLGSGLGASRFRARVSLTARIILHPFIVFPGLGFRVGSGLDNLG